MTTMRLPVMGWSVRLCLGVAPIKMAGVVGRSFASAVTRRTVPNIPRMVCN